MQLGEMESCLDSTYKIKILYHQLYSGHMEIRGTLEAHQGPWGHHKIGILDLGGKNKYWEQILSICYLFQICTFLNIKFFEI